MAEHNETGKEGEQEASDYLIKQGFRIIHRNWRWRRNELDIIAFKDRQLIVVEVKTRSVNYLVAPEEAVNKTKIKRIVAATDAYIRYHNIPYPVRFDIITIVKTHEGHRIEHIEEAFYAPVN